MSLQPPEGPSDAIVVTNPGLGADGRHPLEDLAARRIPWFDAWCTTHLCRGLHLGATDDDWALSRPERSIMILGPPRDTGKTTAVLVPLVLSAYAPVVAASTKDDVFAATALVRALQGRLWHFAPDGVEATPVGCRQLRWSPVSAAADWDTAVTTAEVMIATTDRTLGTHARTEGGFWSIQAGAILAPLLHAAALAGRDMRTVLGWVMLRRLGEAADILADELARQRAAGAEAPGTRAAANLLVGADRTAPAELSGYWGSANAALSPYRREAALAVTDQPNFSPADFGGYYTHPDGVPAFDTVYINSSGQHQERLAPLIVGLLNQIKEARYTRHRKLQALAPGCWLPPVVLALDETANLAPPPDLPSVVSQGGSQGVVVIAVFQNLQQAKAGWGEEGLGFLTNFQERLIFPGIWDKETLETISAVVGDYDRPITSTSEDPTQPGGSQFRYTHSIQREPILPPADIRAGYPDQPTVALYLRGRHHYWLHTTAYYACHPWPQLLIAAMERWATAPERYPQRRLPVPELGRTDPDTGLPWLTHPQLDPTGTLLRRYARARQLLRQPGA